jgi:pyrimidine operon attenuation protein/uracil phosphoribosyltransferase
MSIHKETYESDLETAYRTGMGNFRGDSKVAEDLGIAVDPDTLESHLESARQVRAALQAAQQVGRVANISALAMTAPDAIEHAELGPVDPDTIR